MGRSAVRQRLTPVAFRLKLITNSDENEVLPVLKIWILAALVCFSVLLITTSAYAQGGGEPYGGPAIAAGGGIPGATHWRWDLPNA